MWNLCRTCLAKEVEMISIFDQGKSPSISAMIMTISSLEFLPNDKLPSEMCITCFDTLEMTYYFKKQVTRCNDALQKQQKHVQRTALLARCKMLAQQQGNREVTEKRQMEEFVSNEHLEYVPKVDVDDVATENMADCPSKCDPLLIDNNTYNPSSKCDVSSLAGVLPLTSVASEVGPAKSSSHYVKDVSPHFEETDSKTEIIEIEEHGVQFGDDCEITSIEIISNNMADDDEFYSDDDLPLKSVAGSTESYSTSQNVQQDSNENGVGTSEASEGLNTLRDVGNFSIGKPFKCTNCNKLFNHESLLKAHICKYIHPYKCDFCEKTFCAPSRLKEHLRKHSSEKSFKCQYCNATYKYFSTLKIHTRLHTGESTPRYHACKVCGKKFRSPFEVKIHMRTHTGERPFSCQYCNAKFAKKDSLVNHTRLHTGETTVKPYKCDVCESSFDAPSQLKRHKIKHTDEKPFKCQLCNATFKSTSSLNYHMRSHTGEPKAKPHKCDVCQLSFETPSRLKRHMRRHTGEAPPKPHRCAVCGKSFEVPCTLRKHMECHMNEIEYQDTHSHETRPKSHKCVSNLNQPI